MLKRPLKWLRSQSLNSVLGVLVLVILSFFLFIWRLGSLVPGFSPNELAAKVASAGFHKILADPLFAPHKIVQAVVGHLGFHGPTSMRLVSVLFAVVFAGCFYYVANSWYGKQAGFFSTLIFISTPLVLVASRNSTPDIIYLWPVGVAAAHTWLLHTKTKGVAAWLILCLVGAACIYIPGLIWFALLAAIFVKDKLALVIKSLPKLYSSLGIFLAAVLVAGAVTSGLHHHQIAKQILGLPASQHHLSTLLKSVGWSASSLVWRTQAHNPLILGRLPILNILQIALLLIGGWALWTRSARRVISVAGTMAIAILLSGISFNFSLLLATLPAISLLVGVGIRYLFVEWKERFPRNPLPHYFALIVIGAVVALNLAYGMRYALLAWPHSVATTSLYVLK